MTWILQIDTALDIAVVSLSQDGKLFSEKINHFQKDHAAFLHSAVANLVEEAGINLGDLQAIAIVSGPGSYTGLRVGFASAKGLCYALKIPLITIGTLDYMAASALLQLKEINNYGTMLVCPLIDARRMEVFTALYDTRMAEKLAPQALILDDSFLVNWLLNNRIYFFGTGCVKWQAICENKNAFFANVNNNSLVLSALTYNNFYEKKFADLTYSDPMYLKEFHFTAV